MTVERRYSARHSIDLKVHVRYRNRRFYCADACNVSTDGMYLKVQNVTLPTGTLVELEFDTQGKSWLIPAIVIHHHGAGIGVMFRDSQPELFRGLTDQRPSAMPPRHDEASRGQFAKH